MVRYSPQLLIMTVFSYFETTLLRQRSCACFNVTALLCPFGTSTTRAYKEKMDGYALNV